MVGPLPYRTRSSVAGRDVRSAQGATTALHVLEGNGFIRAERGVITTVRNRRGLERFAADAYGRPEAEYRRLIGPLT